MTIDYNSCLPCGKALIKVGSSTVEIPCFYLFALLAPDSSGMVTTIIMDGDFLNHDFDLHKEAKYANRSEYHHGPYGEGSVRRIPNPLNSELSLFHLRHILIVKKHDLLTLKQPAICTERIIRDDKYGNPFHYVVIDKTANLSLETDQLPVRRDVFEACNARKPREHIPSMPKLKPLGRERCQNI